MVTAAKHDYRSCHDSGCDRKLCEAWNEAWAEGRQIGFIEGYEVGFAAGFEAGQSEGG